LSCVRDYRIVELYTVITYTPDRDIHTVVETPVFIRSAKKAGVTEDELDHIKTFLAQEPEAGDEMPGTGGARKIRFAAKGKGKGGGYRVITFYRIFTQAIFSYLIVNKRIKCYFRENPSGYKSLTLEKSTA
jgi:hypothetical protein